MLIFLSFCWSTGVLAMFKYCKYSRTVCIHFPPVFLQHGVTVFNLEKPKCHKNNNYMTCSSLLQTRSISETIPDVTYCPTLTLNWSVTRITHLAVLIHVLNSQIILWHSWCPHSVLLFLFWHRKDLEKFFEQMNANKALGPSQYSQSKRYICGAVSQHEATLLLTDCHLFP